MPEGFAPKKTGKKRPQKEEYAVKTCGGEANGMGSKKSSIGKGKGKNEDG